MKRCISSQNKKVDLTLNKRSFGLELGAVYVEGLEGSASVTEVYFR